MEYSRLSQNIQGQIASGYNLYSHIHHMLYPQDNGYIHSPILFELFMAYAAFTGYPISRSIENEAIYIQNKLSNQHVFDGKDEKRMLDIKDESQLVRVLCEALVLEQADLKLREFAESLNRL